MIASSTFDSQTPSNLEKSLNKIKSKAKDLSETGKFQLICEAIYEFIENTPSPCFLLPAILKIINSINQSFMLEEPFRIYNFERWLNTLSDVSESKNTEIRSKIAGRHIPRDEYHTFFPVGGGKRHVGAHFVTAHSSPDLDTAVASFWSWIDAFAARVSSGEHYWNIPGGHLSDQDEQVFIENLGQNVFDSLAKSRSILTLRAIDLLTPGRLIHCPSTTALKDISNEKFEIGVIAVDERGYYLGDWRRRDLEMIRPLLSLLSSGLRSFQSKLQASLISLFGLNDLTQKKLVDKLHQLKQIKFDSLEPLQEASERERTCLEKYFKVILHCQEGLQSSFLSFSQNLEKLKIDSFSQLFEKIDKLFSSSDLFEKNGALTQDRHQIMQALQNCLDLFENSLQSFRTLSETLEIAMRIKHEVLLLGEEHVSSKTDVDELHDLIGNKAYLTVVYQEKSGKLIPLGGIYADTLRRKHLGTASLRDFCNREEVKIAPYFEIISVVDHHKSDLRSVSAPVAIISDTQSCNTLMAIHQIAINDHYSTLGQDAKEIEKAFAHAEGQSGLKKRLIQRKIALENISKGYFVDKSREALEYLFYLFAIVDDTDLLAKVSARDLFAVCELINRLETLENGKESLPLSLDDLSRDETFLKKATKRILKSQAMYKLYTKVYAFKEESLKNQLQLYTSAKPSTLFCDTKIQNGCTRVGQIKLPSNMIETFSEHKTKVFHRWVKEAAEASLEPSEVDLHIQMISTIASAQDVYEERSGGYSHRDELWIYSPLTERASEHLCHFLRAFRFAKELEGQELELELADSDKLELLFEQNFLPIKAKKSKSKIEKGAVAILRFTPMKLNSRKAAITPYLPTILS